MEKYSTLDRCKSNYDKIYSILIDIIDDDNNNNISNIDAIKILDLFRYWNGYQMFTDDFTNFFKLELGLEDEEDEEDEEEKEQ